MYPLAALSALAAAGAGAAAPIASASGSAAGGAAGVAASTGSGSRTSPGFGVADSSAGVARTPSAASGSLAVEAANATRAHSVLQALASGGTTSTTSAAAFSDAADTIMQGTAASPPAAPAAATTTTPSPKGLSPSAPGGSQTVSPAGAGDAAGAAAASAGSAKAAKVITFPFPDGVLARGPLRWRVPSTPIGSSMTTAASSSSATSSSSSSAATATAAKQLAARWPGRETAIKVFEPALSEPCALLPASVVFGLRSAQAPDFLRDLYRTKGVAWSEVECRGHANVRSLWEATLHACAKGMLNWLLRTLHHVALSAASAVCNGVPLIRIGARPSAAAGAVPAPPHVAAAAAFRADVAGSLPLEAKVFDVTARECLQAIIDHFVHPCRGIEGRNFVNALAAWADSAPGPQTVRETVVARTLAVDGSLTAAPGDGRPVGDAEVGVSLAVTAAEAVQRNFHSAASAAEVDADIGPRRCDSLATFLKAAQAIHSVRLADVAAVAHAMLRSRLAIHEKMATQAAARRAAADAVSQGLLFAQSSSPAAGIARSLVVSHADGRATTPFRAAGPTAVAFGAAVAPPSAGGGTVSPILGAGPAAAVTSLSFSSPAATARSIAGGPFGTPAPVAAGSGRAAATSTPPTSALMRVAGAAKSAPYREDLDPFLYAARAAGGGTLLIHDKFTLEAAKKPLGQRLYNPCPCNGTSCPLRLIEFRHSALSE